MGTVLLALPWSKHLAFEKPTLTTVMFASILVASLLLVSSITATPIARQSDPDNGSCEQLQNICVDQVNNQVSNPWTYPACIFGASCFGGQRPVDDFLASTFDLKNNCSDSEPPMSVNEPRVTEQMFQSISKGGEFITQQNWIDGYYHTLDLTHGPYPTSPSIVIGDFDRIATWTGFCNGNIPFKNFADYYQYSSSVSSNGC